MSSDDQHFFDILGSISKDIRKFSNDVADATDRHFENVAASIKESLAAASWLPQSARRASPAPAPAPAVAGASPALLDRAQRWLLRNRALVAAVIALAGTGSVMVYAQKKHYTRKRRAKRASNGARKEVVVLCGPPSSPITKSLAQDLERRGFIVYVVVSTAEEEQMVQSEARPDIRPLHLDVIDPIHTQQVIERFNTVLLKEHHPFPAAPPHTLNFAGLVLVPDLIYPSGPIETICPELWSDALNAKVLNTVATAQAFLPSVCEFKARVLVLTPSIVSSLKPPFHGVESAVVGALEGFTSSLRGELGTLGIRVCHLKLGTFDCSAVGAKNHIQPIGATRTAAWPASTRALYAQNYVTQSRIAGSKGLFAENGSAAKGSSLRELHNAVFDALTQRRPNKVWRVGRGSLAYDLVGSWVPTGVVGWMLGIRRVAVEASDSKLEESVYSWEKVERVDKAL